MSPARARTRTARSGVELTNHEATAPPYHAISFNVSKPGIIHLVSQIHFFSSPAEKEEKVRIEKVPHAHDHKVWLCLNFII